MSFIFRDKAMAMALYAKQAKDETLEADARAIRFRAECRLGDMMAAQKTNGLLPEGAPKGNQNAAKQRVAEKPVVIAPTLAAAGIDKNLAHTARQAAALSHEERDNREAEIRDGVFSRAEQRAPS